jgi:hypothetical protein
LQKVQMTLFIESPSLMTSLLFYGDKNLFYYM